MKFRIPEDLSAGNFSPIVPKIHQRLLKKTLLAHTNQTQPSYNIFLFMKKYFLLSGAAVVVLLFLSLSSFILTPHSQSRFSPELRALIAKAQPFLEEKSAMGKYYHQKFTRKYPAPIFKPEDALKPPEYMSEMVETWANTTNDDFIVVFTNLKTNEMYGSMSKNKGYYLFDLKDGKFELRPQGPLIEDKRVFNPSYHLDYGKILGQGLKSVIAGENDIDSLKKLLPYSDVTNPQYMGIAAVDEDGKGLEGLSFKGISSDSDEIEFFFSAENFELKFFRTISRGAKSYSNETGQWVEIKTDLQSEYKYLFSQYSDQKPVVELGGETLNI